MIARDATVSPAARNLISIVIPAWREEGRVGRTVRAVRAALDARPELCAEVLVVDDGSPDGTAREAEAAGARVLVLPRNLGKGGALEAGFRAAQGDVLVMLDADLAETAGEGLSLLEPVLAGRADLTIGAFIHAPDAVEAAGASGASPADDTIPSVAQIGQGGRRKTYSGGFGLVQNFARWAGRRWGGPSLHSPISGQRALTRAAWEKIGHLDRAAAGLEVGMNLDAARAGLRIEEVPVRMRHRATGRGWAGWRHRARQGAAVLRALLRRL